MKRYEAWKKALVAWNAYGLPFAKVKRKTVVDRFEVGYYGRGTSGRRVVMGSGPSWEIAFERASKVSQ